MEFLQVHKHFHMHSTQAIKKLHLNKIIYTFWRGRPKRTHVYAEAFSNKRLLLKRPT
jgi:hypothetical protein